MWLDTVVEKYIASPIKVKTQKGDSVLSFPLSALVLMRKESAGHHVKTNDKLRPTSDARNLLTKRTLEKHSKAPRRHVVLLYILLPEQ